MWQLCERGRVDIWMTFHNDNYRVYRIFIYKDRPLLHDIKWGVVGKHSSNKYKIQMKLLNCKV
jgi:hypothetical protein